jgi:prolyl-tRNA synthetase
MMMLDVFLLTGKWARGGWAASDEEERRIKEETQATLRCFPFDQVGLYLKLVMLYS